MRGFARQRAFDDILHQMSPRYTLYNERVVTFLFFGEIVGGTGLEVLKQRISALFPGKYADILM